jgi:photosystem II stability/assembly factor-like uncharacterized protein
MSRFKRFSVALICASLLVGVGGVSAVTGNATWVEGTTALGDSQYGIAYSDDMKHLAIPSWGAINKSDDGGATWTQLTPPGSMNFAYAWLSPTGSDLWFNSLSQNENGGLWKYGTDNVLNHVGVMPEEFPLPVWDFAVSRDQQHVFALDDDGNVWRSNDVAETWNKLNRDFGWGVPRISPDNVLFISDSVNDGKLWRSTNWGDTLTPILTPPTGLGVGEVASGNASTAIIVNILDWNIGTSSLKISYNNGNTWSDVTSNAFESELWTYYVGVSNDGNHLVAAKEKNVYVSDDAGATWSRQNSLTISRGVLGVAISPLGTLAMVQDQNNKVWQLDRRLPAKPVFLAPTLSSKQAIIKWRVNSLGPVITKYEYCISKCNLAKSWIKTKAKKSEVTLKGLSKGKKYTVKVRATNQNGVGAVATKSFKSK